MIIASLNSLKSAFKGTTRDNAKDGREVLRLEYSCYPEMAMKELANLAEHVIKTYGLRRVAIHHHIGAVPPCQAGVLGF